MNKYLVTGGKGLVGNVIVNKLIQAGESVEYTTREKVNLFNFEETLEFFRQINPTHIINAAAKVGGIKANNDFAADFISENLLIQNNVILAAAELKVPKFIFLGSACIYPKFAPQPIPESALLSGPLEVSNEWYAIAKIAGLKMVQAFRKQYKLDWISLMPNNVYGPRDNFDTQNGHVIGALINKFVRAQILKLDQVEVWGTGTSRREFIYVDDLADAIIFCSNHYNEFDPINVGVGTDISIKDLAILIKKLTEFRGEIIFNNNYPDGTPQKLVNIDKISKLGWRPKVDLEVGLLNTINWYRENMQLLESKD